MKAIFTAIVASLLTAAPVLALQPPTAGGASQDGFVPLDQLPPAEQLPAAPLLITAYAFVWVLLMAYLFSIAKRLRKVESEMTALQSRTSKGAGR